MSKIYWKAFKFDDLFTLDGSYNTKKSNKTLNISKEKTKTHSLLLINKGGLNNAEEGYIRPNKKYKTIMKAITMDDQFGNCFYHPEEFIMTGGGHINVVLFKSLIFKNIADKYEEVYYYLSILFRKIFKKSGIFGYMYKITNERPGRELILLPLKISNENFIWEFNEIKYTIDFEYIIELMEKAKINKEKRTIKFYEAEKAKYEAEKAKYEAEKAKYEAEYFSEQKNIRWKAFQLGELFEESTEHYLEKSKKHYNISEHKTEEFNVAVCAASKYNNGIVGYIAEVEDVPEKKRKGFLTKGGFGHVFYQKDWFIKPGGSWGMLNIIKIKNNKLLAILNEDETLYCFLSKILTKIFTGMSSWGYSVPFSREIILLPVLETTNENYVWEYNKKNYTIAKGTMSYLYFQGKVNEQQKNIDNYVYQP